MYCLLHVWERVAQNPPDPTTSDVAPLLSDKSDVAPLLSDSSDVAPLMSD